jgi:lipoyl(octanoyl) transferase
VRDRRLQGRWLGRRAYGPVLELQRRLLLARQQGRISDTVLFVEHSPVVTLGRGAKAEHVLASARTLTELGVDVQSVDRGGDVTLHAPGQLVCYPIMDLNPERRDVRRYVRDLAESMRRVIGEFGLDGGLVDGLVGLWVDAACPGTWPGQEQARHLAKIGAIGVRLSRWVTMHGYALNVTTDLALFGLIVPCGIRNHDVQSIQSLTGATPDLDDLVSKAYEHLSAVFGAEPTGLVDRSRDDDYSTSPEAS